MATFFTSCTAGVFAALTHKGGKHIPMNGPVGTQAVLTVTSPDNVIIDGIYAINTNKRTQVKLLDGNGQLVIPIIYPNSKSPCLSTAQSKAIRSVVMTRIEAFQIPQQIMGFNLLELLLVLVLLFLIYVAYSRYVASC